MIATNTEAAPYVEKSPATGRIVHFVNEAGEHSAAIVDTPHEAGHVDLVEIFIGKPGEPHIQARHMIAHQEPTSEDGKLRPKTWHYPEGSPTSPGASNGLASLASTIAKRLDQQDADIASLKSLVAALTAKGGA